MQYLKETMRFERQQHCTDDTVTYLVIKIP